MGGRVIGILDYGMGNLGSVQNALDFIGAPARIVTSPDELDPCQGLIFPGVGAFGDCMAHLQAQQLITPLQEWIRADRPLLGICLGLQALCAASEESPGVEGLGIVKTPVVKFTASAEYKVPQIGWNRVTAKMREDCPLFRGIPPQSYFYFVNSFYLPSADGWEAGTTEYAGVEFISAIWLGRVGAVQFHPEKSQIAGLQMLKNFVELAKN